jgi:hypothetical protein
LSCRARSDEQNTKDVMNPDIMAVAAIAEEVFEEMDEWGE